MRIFLNGGTKEEPHDRMLTDVGIASFSQTEAVLEIRTFLDAQTLNKERRFVRDRMIEISEPLLESSLSASPAAVVAGVDSSALLLMTVVCKKLMPHAHALASCVFRDEEAASGGNMERVFLERLSHFAATADSFWEAFENMPLRDF